MKFAERLVKLRKMQHLSQAQLARRLGVTTRTIQNYESSVHDNEPSVKMKKKIAEVLQISVDALESDTVCNQILGKEMSFPSRRNDNVNECRHFSTNLCTSSTDPIRFNIPSVVASVLKKCFKLNHKRIMVDTVTTSLKDERYEREKRILELQVKASDLEEQIRALELEKLNLQSLISDIEQEIMAQRNSIHAIDSFLGTTNLFDERIRRALEEVIKRFY